MKHLTDLFKLVEMTRTQPQYGYITGGVHETDKLSNLAEHHYLVTFIAWQIARQLKNKGAKIDVAKVVEFSLIHDLGEVFGGDISSHYRMVNPKALEYAKAFEEENQKFIAKFFADDEKHFTNLGHEILDAKSDEALIAKVADYVEATHYKEYMGAFSKEFDVTFILPKIKNYVSKIKDPVAKKELNKFIDSWSKDILKGGLRDILLKAKK